MSSFDRGQVASRSGLFAAGADRVDRVMAALEAAGLPRRTDVFRMPEGIPNQVYRVGHEFIVRLGAGPDDDRIRRSSEILRYAQGAIPCPQLVDSGDAGDAAAVPYMITRYVPGRTLNHIWPTLDLVGRETYLKRLVDVCVELHELDYRKIPFFSKVAPWPERQRARMARAVDAAGSRANIDRTLVDSLTRFWHEYEHLLDTAALPVLIHNDVNPGNVIFDDEGRVASLVDFDDADVAPWEIEYWCLCNAFLNDAEPDREELEIFLRNCHGFEGVHALERRKLNEALSMMESLVASGSRQEMTRRIERDYRGWFVEDRYRNWFRIPAG